MNRLLNANFARMFKSGVFYLCLFISVELGILMMCSRALDISCNPEYYADLSAEFKNMDGILFSGSLYMLFISAVFISFFVGTDYSDGTIRNKLTAGHTRINIYLSNLITCAAAAAILNLSCIGTGALLGQILLEPTCLTLGEILTFTLYEVIILTAFSAFLLMLSMLVRKKAVSCCLVLILSFMMLMASLNIKMNLNAPEFYPSYEIEYTEDGIPKENTNTEEMIQNPHYLTGMERKIYEMLDNFLPSSQIYQMMDYDAQNILEILISDAVILIVSTGVGIAGFKRKDLK